MRPLVTAVVATFNEERHIERCLRELLDQRDMHGKLEILVVDGGSTDRTAEIVRLHPEFGSTIRLVENPKRFQVFAYNQGIRMANGTYVMFVVAHAEYGDDYIAQAIALSERLGAANVGGTPKALGDGAIGRTIAYAMSSPYGVGDATFRYVDDERYVDSVLVGFVRRDVLQEIGGFNEDVPFDEDTDLNLRLRAAGYKLATSPKLRCRYHVRRTLPALASQMFRYGFWRRKSQLNFGARIPYRVLAPPALVLGLLLSPIAPQPLCWLVPAAYACFTAVASAAAIPRLGALAMLLPIVLLTMHVSYGLGWLKGLFVHRAPDEAYGNRI